MSRRIPASYANEFRFFFSIGAVAGWRGENAEDASLELDRFGFHAPMLWCLRAFYAGYENGAKWYANE